MEGTSIFKLYGSILVDSSKAEQSIAKTADKAESMGSKLGNGIKKAGKWGLAVAAGAATVGAAAVGMATKMADSASTIDDMSQRTGMNAEELQKYQYAAKLSGIEAETLEKAMIKQQKAFADASTGSKSASEAYNQLGIDISSIGSSSEAFDQVITKLADMEDKTKRDAIANDIFGKSYAQLSPLLNEGSEGIEKLKKEAEDMGFVLSEDSVKAGAKFGDTLDSLKMAGQGITNQLGAELMPYMQKLADWIVKHMPEIKRVIKNVFETIGKVVKTAGKIFDALLPILKPIWKFISWAFPRILQVTQDVFGAIKPIIEGVADAFETVAGWIQKAYDKWEQWRNRKEDKFTDYSDLGGAGDGGQGGGGGTGWGEASGIAYVPYDGFKAKLHKGERVLNRGEVANQNQSNITINITGNNISSDYDVDRIGDRIAAKLQQENRRLANRTSLIPI